MNTFTTIETSYITPSRTIETILLQNTNSNRVIYLYNYEGLHFRIFNTTIELVDFFTNQTEAGISFEDEQALDQYLATA